MKTLPNAGHVDTALLKMLCFTKFSLKTNIFTNVLRTFNDTTAREWCACGTFENYDEILFYKFIPNIPTNLSYHFAFNILSVLVANQVFSKRAGNL